MIRLYLGTDRESVRAHMNDAINQCALHAHIVRITDAHTIEDLRSSLAGGGMFAEARVLVYEGVCTNSDLYDVFIEALEYLRDSEEHVFVYEEKPLAELKKKLEKHAKSIEKFDAPKKERDTSVFVIADALKRGDKKGMWVSYMREINKGAAPEAVHGILFWAAKDMLLKSSGTTVPKARALVASLSELPHAARRRGEELEYALERFLLS